MLPEPLIRYANPPSNILGTALFLTYILLALIITTYITLSLYHLSQHNRKNAHPKTLKPLILLSTLTFVTLSYHMLLFLLKSYARWRMTKTMFKPEEAVNTSPWTWMLESSLFTSFAQELVGDAPSAAITHVALLETWLWNLWVARTARAKSFSTKSILPYILLGQILPATFSASLFAIRIQLTSEEPSHDYTYVPSSMPSKTTNKKAANEPSSPLLSPFILITTTLLFTTLCSILPNYKTSTTLLITLVIATRAFLLLPHLGMFRGGIGTGIGIGSSARVIRNNLVFTVAAVIVGILAFVPKSGVGDIGKVLWKGGESVKALGWDGLIGVLVGVWIWGVGAA